MVASISSQSYSFEFLSLFKGTKLGSDNSFQSAFEAQLGSKDEDNKQFIENVYTADTSDYIDFSKFDRTKINSIDDYVRERGKLYGADGKFDDPTKNIWNTDTNPVYEEFNAFMEYHGCKNTAELKELNAPDELPQWKQEEIKRETEAMKGVLSATLNMHIIGVRMRNLGEFDLSSQEITDSIINNMSYEELKEFTSLRGISVADNSGDENGVGKLQELVTKIAQRTNNSTLASFNSWLDTYQNQLAWEKENGGFNYDYYVELSKSKMFGSAYTPTMDLSNAYRNNWVESFKDDENDKEKEKSVSPIEKQDYSQYSEKYGQDYALKLALGYEV